MADKDQRDGGAPRPLKRVVIKEELVELTGDFRRALILNQFLYWSHRTRDYDAFLKEEKERNPDLDIEPTHGWIYKKAEELADELMLGCSVQTVLRHIEPLVEAGWLQRRHNPRYGWDRTFQYRPDIHAIQRDLYALGYVLDDYPLLIGLPDSSNFQNGKRTSKMETASPKTENQTVENGRAIPETTSQVTSETTTEENRGASAPVSAPAPGDDALVDELFPETDSDDKDNGNGKRITECGSYLGMCAEVERKREGIPDWAMLAEGVDPGFEVIKALCELTGQPVDTLTPKRGKALLRHYAKIAQENGVTLDQLARAHPVLRLEQWGKWYLDHHKWSTGYERKYIDQLVLAAGQIRTGQLQPTDDGQVVENVPDEILAQGTGLKAILAHERLKERRKHTGDRQ